MIPLEDNFADVIGKAQRGRQLNDVELAAAAGISTAQLRALKRGEFDGRAVRQLAPALRLGANQLVALGQGTWQPEPASLTGLEQFTMPFGSTSVNSYIAWDPTCLRAVAFDTGAECDAMLQYVRDNRLTLELILLTHAHRDHVGDLARLRTATGARAFISRLEPLEGVETFKHGYIFSVGRMTVETLLTSGHTVGGTTYRVNGLERPVAVTGDALFAGSIGGANVSYEDALRNLWERVLTMPAETIICPGHGPLTTVGEEQQHNPFFTGWQG